MSVLRASGFNVRRWLRALALATAFLMALAALVPTTSTAEEIPYPPAPWANDPCGTADDTGETPVVGSEYQYFIYVVDEYGYMYISLPSGKTWSNQGQNPAVIMVKYNGVLLPDAWTLTWTDKPCVAEAQNRAWLEYVECYPEYGYAKVLAWFENTADDSGLPQRNISLEASHNSSHGYLANDVIDFVGDGQSGAVTLGQFMIDYTNDPYATNVRAGTWRVVFRFTDHTGIKHKMVRKIDVPSCSDPDDPPPVARAKPDAKISQVRSTHRMKVRFINRKVEMATKFRVVVRHAGKVRKVYRLKTAPNETKVKIYRGKPRDKFIVQARIGSKWPTVGTKTLT